MDREHKGILYGVVAALANSCMSVFVKLSAEVPNETMVFARFFIGFLILLPFYIQGKIRISRIHFSKHMLRALLGLLSIYLYYFALKGLPLANAISLANTTPLFTPFVLLVWLRLLVSKWKFIAAAIGFMGVLLMLNPAQFSFDIENFAALGSGLGAATVFVGIRQLSKVESTGAILFYYFSVATIISFFPCMYTWGPIPDLKIWIYLLSMGVIGIVFQYLATLAFSMAPSSKVGLTTYLAIVFGGFWGWIIWDEVPRFWGAVGMLLTIVGGALAVLDKSEARKIR
jgi:drug/metabolite transporter (DMT)-like permease